MADTARLDGTNGLLLSPHIDHLFDEGYITFSGSQDWSSFRRCGTHFWTRGASTSACAWANSREIRARSWTTTEPNDERTIANRGGCRSARDAEKVSEGCAESFEVPRRPEAQVMAVLVGRRVFVAVSEAQRRDWPSTTPG
jgi:hypothetical protein